jgi:hypothetical protein
MTTGRRVAAVVLGGVSFCVASAMGPVLAHMLGVRVEGPAVGLSVLFGLAMAAMVTGVILGERP